MVTTVAHNVLSQPVGTVYLNEPLNKSTEEVNEDKTEPQNPAGTGEATSAPLTNEEETYKKRHDDLKRHYDNMVNSYKAQLTEKEAELNSTRDKLVSAEAFKAPKTKEETKAFMDKYPELADNIVSLASEVFSKTNQAVEAKLKQLEEAQKAQAAQLGIQELKKYHPDFEQIKDDPRFLDWFNRQPNEVKALIRSSNPVVIAKGLDLFKEFAGIKSPKEAKKDATREVKTPTNRVQIGEPGKRTYTNAEINKMSIQEFEKLQDDIKAAQYEGRIVG